jgi:hypothetical protein
VGGGGATGRILRLKTVTTRYNFTIVNQHIIISTEWLGLRPRSLGRIVPLHGSAVPFIPDSVTYSAPLFLARQCDRAPGVIVDQ